MNENKTSFLECYRAQKITLLLFSLHLLYLPFYVKNFTRNSKTLGGKLLSETKKDPFITIWFLQNHRFRNIWADK